MEYNSLKKQPSFKNKLVSQIIENKPLLTSRGAQAAKAIQKIQSYDKRRV